MFLSILRGDTAFGTAQPTKKSQWQSKGGVKIQDWNEVHFDIICDQKEFIAADCIQMNTGADGVLLSNYSLEVLTPLLKDSVQFLPVRISERPYWWLNCVSLIDGLDRKQTDADWSKIAGDWGSFEWISGTRRLEFRHDQLIGAPVLFRIPEYPQGFLFAKDELRSAVKSHDLIGFIFEPVWSSVTGGVSYSSEIETSRMFDIPVKADLDHRRSHAKNVLDSRRHDSKI